MLASNQRPLHDSQLVDHLATLYLTELTRFVTDMIPNAYLLAIGLSGFLPKFGFPFCLRHSFAIVFTWLAVKTRVAPNFRKKPSRVAHRDTVDTEHPICFAASVAVFMLTQ